MTNPGAVGPTLKPCPFCNSANLEHDEFEGLWYVECMNCHATVSGFKWASEAEAAWNRRSPAPAAAPQGPSPSAVSDLDAARWAWVRDHAFLVVGEDDDIAVVLVVMGEGASERGSTPFLTAEERAVLIGNKVGRLPDGDAVTRTVDHLRGKHG